MTLQITLVKTPAKVSVSKTSQTFNKQGGTLGRADSNAWVLPDPDKFLSSCHCELLYDVNKYYLLDLSTNGTFFNNSMEPLGKGTKTVLTDGDVFEVGEYRFSVKLLADQSFANNSPFASNQSFSNASNTDDIFGNAQPLGASFADPFADNGFIPADFSLGGGNHSVDPLVALDQARKTADTNIFGGDRLFESNSKSIPNDDLFLGHSQTDHSPSLDQAISWPTASQENLIPEDWGGDFMDSSPDPFSLPAEPQEFPQVNKVQIDPFADTSSPFATELPIKKVPPAQTQIPVSTPISKPVVAPVIQQPVIPQKTPEQYASVAPSNNRLITAMGLDTSRLTADQMDEISDVVGELMREIVDGMMQVLRSRTSIKNEFRMNVTTIQPVENNPLKFSVGVDEALENMFLKKTNAYKKPVDAFREGFQEIGEHQVAMIAGIRFGFERMVERFNPDDLEKSFNKHGKGGGVIPGMQKAKYWTSYKDHYLSFVDNMESSFQHLFGSDFVNAYEEQLRKLAAARKKNK